MVRGYQYRDLNLIPKTQRSQYTDVFAGQQSSENKALLARMSLRPRSPRDLANYDVMVPMKQQGINYPIQINDPTTGRSITTGQTLDDLMAEVDATAMTRAPGKIEEVYLRSPGYDVSTNRSISQGKLESSLANSGMSLQQFTNLPREQKQRALRDALSSDREMGYGEIMGDRPTLAGSGSMKIFDTFRQELGETPSISQQIEAATSMPGESPFTGTAAQWKFGQPGTGREVNLFSEGNYPKVMPIKAGMDLPDAIQENREQASLAKGVFNQAQATYDNALSEITRQDDFGLAASRQIRPQEKIAAKALDDMIVAGQIYGDATAGRPIDYSRLEPINQQVEPPITLQRDISNLRQQERVLKGRGLPGFTPTEQLMQTPGAIALRQRAEQAQSFNDAIAQRGQERIASGEASMGAANRMYEIQSRYDQPTRIAPPRRPTMVGTPRERAQALLRQRGMI
ncbi:hypothetical protein K9N68_37565 (plasmid) [Kovacikia minuta CCNUW1]|uniref:hypothetical protein n=1 Tax=Kovacikia minuta TaxID=2931930 RepID=UPI001CCB063D|nr:hypothetical protein [Kovacikia minuta]UBF29922.1 hypothetical protein K9N68_37565 [Kovacikia minuta CCNUW1]